MTTVAKKTTKKGLAKPTQKKTEPKKPSKTWLAMMANKGTGEILDMRAVLK